MIGVFKEKERHKRAVRVINRSQMLGSLQQLRLFDKDVLVLG